MTPHSVQAIRDLVRRPFHFMRTTYDQPPLSGRMGLSTIVGGGADHRARVTVGRWTIQVTVYVDDVRHRFGRMIMCHMWADTVDELHAFAARLGLKRSWFQCPPKASWEHYDISLGLRTKAIALGAVVTDKYGPVEHEARKRGDHRKLDLIADLRKRWAA